MLLNKCLEQMHVHFMLFLQFLTTKNVFGYLFRTLFCLVKSFNLTFIFFWLTQSCKIKSNNFTWKQIYYLSHCTHLYFIGVAKQKFVRNHNHKERVRTFLKNSVIFFLASKKLRKWNFILTTLQMIYYYFEKAVVCLSHIVQSWKKFKREKSVEMSFFSVV